MRTSPPIVPHAPDQDAYLALDDFGRLGQAWRETDVNAAGRDTVIRFLLAGEYTNPVLIIAFNTHEGWSRDMTVDELHRRYDEFEEVPESILSLLDLASRH